MIAGSTSLCTVFVVAIAIAWSGTTRAAEVNVLSAGAAKSSVGPLLEPFRRDTGIEVRIEFATAGVIQQKLKSGARPDVVIITSGVMAELEKAGAIVAGSAANLGQTGVGVAVREGAPMPDISTVDAFRRALLAARAVAYIDPAGGGTSGKHFAGVLQRLGIEDAVKAKAVLVPGGYAAEPVARGEADMAVHQISEILPVKGVKLVGPLPAELQLITTYTAGVAAGAANAENARRLIAYLTSPASRAAYAAGGLEAPK